MATFENVAGGGGKVSSSTRSGRGGSFASPRTGRGGSFDSSRTGRGGSFAPMSSTKKVAPPAPVKKPPAPSQPGRSGGRTGAINLPNSYSGGGSSPNSSGGSNLAPSASGIVSTPAVASLSAPVVPSLEDWRAKDSLYNSLAGKGGSIDTELAAAIDELTRNNTEANRGFDDSLRNLGWDAQAGRWIGAGDQGAMLGAYGQAQTALMNDYSGRGMMDSSFFGSANQDLTDQFNRQRSDYDVARQRANENFGRDKANAQSRANSARSQAIADAAARYAALFNGSV